MPAIAALLERRPALMALRKSFSRSPVKVVTARTPAHLATILSRDLIDTVVIGVDAASGQVLDALRRDYPVIPIVLMMLVRSEDAGVLLRAHRQRVSAIALEGLDEPFLPAIVSRHGVAARRAADLLPLGDVLGLIDPLQRSAWKAVVADAPGGLDTATLAARLGVARETLSRRFAAGGAPPLKRAIDGVRLVAAGQLLGNPAYTVGDAARLLGFSSTSLLQRTARRTLGVAARDIATVNGSRLAKALRGSAEMRSWT